MTCNAPGFMGWSPPPKIAQLGVKHADMRNALPRREGLCKAGERRGAPWRSSHLVVRSLRLRSTGGSVASGAGTRVSFLYAEPSHVLPVQRPSRIEP